MHESFSARVGSKPSLYTLQTWQLLRSLAAGVDLLSLDGRRAVRCIDGIDDIDIVEDTESFVQVAQEVYKALGARSRSGQFRAFSSERTEWMDHKDPVGHRASHSAPLFSSYWSSCFRFVASPGSTTFSVIHRALIPLSVCLCFSSSMGPLIVGRCQAARW